MKITKIEQLHNIFLVTKSPNLLESIFGRKETVKQYMDSGKTYHYFPSTRVYIRHDGKILSPLDKMVDVIEDFRRKF